MIKHTWLLVAVGIFVGGCAVRQADLTPEQLAAADCGTALSQEDGEKILRAFFEQTLIDPFSAHVRNIVVRRASFTPYGGPFARGEEPRCAYKISYELNAKNRLGGYVGWDDDYIWVRDGRVLDPITGK